MRPFRVLLFTVCMVALGASAPADEIFVKTSQVATGGGGTIGNVPLPGPPFFSGTNNGGVSSLVGGQTNGIQFINNTSNNAPFLGGTTISVGVNRLSGNNYVFQNTGSGPTTYNGHDLALVFALTGNSGVPILGQQLFTATGGRAGLFEITNPAAFRLNDPSTYGATSADGKTLLMPIAVFDLKPQERVTDLGPGVPGGGGPGTFNLAGSQTNQIGVNTTVGTASQGFFLFHNSSTFGGSQVEGSNFLKVVGNNPIIPAGMQLVDTALVTGTTETLAVATAGNTAGISGGPGTPGFDALNTISAQLGGLGAFASAFGGAGNPAGPASSFNPSNGAGFPNTSDGIFSFGFNGSGGVEVQAIPPGVPEPASMLLWGAVVAGSGLYARSRRRKLA